MKLETGDLRCVCVCVTLGWARVWHKNKHTQKKRRSLTDKWNKRYAAGWTGVIHNLLSSADVTTGNKWSTEHKRALFITGGGKKSVARGRADTVAQHSYITVHKQAAVIAAAVRRKKSHYPDCDDFRVFTWPWGGLCDLVPGKFPKPENLCLI